MIYNQTTTSLKNTKIQLQKDITYRMELETKWQSSEIIDYMFIEDDHGNLVQEKPNIYIQNTNGSVIVPFEFD